MRLRHAPALTLALAICSALAFAPLRSSAQRPRAVSLLLVNGKVFTADARGTIAEAVAVEGERIDAVGTTRKPEATYTGARTVDPKGKLATPGLNAAHIHFLPCGRS